MEATAKTVTDDRILEIAIRTNREPEAVQDWIERAIDHATDRLGEYMKVRTGRAGRGRSGQTFIGRVAAVDVKFQITGSGVSARYEVKLANKLGSTSTFTVRTMTTHPSERHFQR